MGPRGKPGPGSIALTRMFDRKHRKSRKAQVVVLQGRIQSVYLLPARKGQSATNFFSSPQGGLSWVKFLVIPCIPELKGDCADNIAAPEEVGLVLLVVVEAS